MGSLGQCADQPVDLVTHGARLAARELGQLPERELPLHTPAIGEESDGHRVHEMAEVEILVPFDWSRDGRFLVFGRMLSTTWREKADLWMLELTGERTASPLIESPFRKGEARFSPDSRWIAYESYESGNVQIFVQPFPETGRGKWQVSARGAVLTVARLEPSKVADCLGSRDDGVVKWIGQAEREAVALPLGVGGDRVGGVRTGAARGAGKLQSRGGPGPC